MDIEKFNKSPMHLRAMMMMIGVNFQEFINRMEEETLSILMSTSLISGTHEYTDLFEQFKPIFINVINWIDNISANTSIYMITKEFVSVWSDEMNYHWRSIHDIMHTIYSSQYNEGTKLFNHSINLMCTHFGYIKQLFLTSMPLCQIL